MWKVKVSYSVILTFSRLKDAERALEMLFEGGITEVTIAFEPIKEMTAVAIAFEPIKEMTAEEA